MKRSILPALCALLFSGACLAQSTVADVQQQGGKAMSKDELQKLHEGGVTYKGTTRAGADFTETHKPDGSVNGTAVNPRGSTALTGTWKLSDDGKLCINVKVAATGATLDSCSVIWKAGDKYFASADDGAATAVSARRFEK